LDLAVQPLRSTIQPTLAPGALTLQWAGGGILQHSTDLRTWTDVPNAASPFHLDAMGPGEFYRIRELDLNAPPSGL